MRPTSKLEEPVLEGKFQRQRMKPLQLGINYGMGVRSLARGLDRHPMIASEVLTRHQQRYPVYWTWRENMANNAMVDRGLKSGFDCWPLHLSTSPNRRTLYNFPMQAGGAEMLRLATNQLCAAGLVPIMLVHDGILFELDTMEQAEHAKEIMRNAGVKVCGGLMLGVDEDQKLIGGARYSRQAAGSGQDVEYRDGRVAQARCVDGDRMKDFERYKSKKAPPKVTSKRIPRATELFARITASQAEKLLKLDCMCWPLFTLLVFESLLARGKPFVLPDDISDVATGLSPEKRAPDAPPVGSTRSDFNSTAGAEATVDHPPVRANAQIVPDWPGSNAVAPVGPHHALCNFVV